MNRSLQGRCRWLALLFLSITAMAGCTAPSPIALVPTSPPLSPTRADLTALQLAVERHRQEDILSVQKDQVVPVQENDRVAVDKSGRALLRFSDRLLVELFSGAGIEIDNVHLEPAELVSVRLQQTIGHTRIELESIARVRLVLGTEYATIRPLSSDTEFAVCHDEPVTCTATIAGATEVGAQGQFVTVRAGEGTYIFPGEPPQPPTCVDLNEMRRWLARIRSEEGVEPLVDFVIAQSQQPCPGVTTAPPIVEAPPVSATDAIGDATPAGNGADVPADAGVWINPIDGAVYGHVPAGEFTMGAEADADYSPAHTVYLDAFWIMQTEVTNAQYAQCVETGVCTPPGNERWADPAYAEHPVTDVDWNQANTYATWVGGRLPTEAEWEKAARGTDGRFYPWGNQDPSDRLANFNFTEGGTMPVASYEEGASPYGMLDMAGNVEEWVYDWYDANYYANSPGRNPQGPETGLLRVLRGGSFYHNLLDVRSFVRAKILPAGKFDGVGFRVATSTPNGEER